MPEVWFSQVPKWGAFCTRCGNSKSMLAREWFLASGNAGTRPQQDWMAEPEEHEDKMKGLRDQALVFHKHLVAGATRDTVKVKRLVHSFAWALTDPTKEAPKQRK